MEVRKIYRLKSKNSHQIRSLDIQTPPEKVFEPPKTYLKHRTSGCIWMSRDQIFSDFSQLRGEHIQENNFGNKPPPNREP